MEIQESPDGLQMLTVIAPEFDATVEVSGDSPVQGFGTVLGRDLYFRARHDHWSFEVADSAGNLPSDGYFDSDGFYRDGKYSNANYMPLRDAVKIIAKCLAEFTGTH